MWTTVNHPEAIVDFTGKLQRISAFLITGQGDGKFLEFSRLKAKAQAGYNPKNIVTTDFLNASTSVPIFSPRLVEKLGKELDTDADFYPCTITCQGQEFDFFAAKIKTRVDLIDKELSTYRTLTDGEKSLMKAAYKTHFDRDFLLARDSGELFDFAVSEIFRDLAYKHALDISFIERPQA